MIQGRIKNHKMESPNSAEESHNYSKDGKALHIKADDFWDIGSLGQVFK